MNKNSKSFIFVGVLLVGLFIFDSFSTNQSTMQVEAQDNKSELYGFWVNKDSYIVISNSGSKMNLKEYIKNESEIDHGKFELSSRDTNRFEGQFLDSKKDISFKLSEDKKKITVTKDGESKVFKYTDVSPIDYVSTYN
ncbi:hypothetical protein G3A_13585 [Bacillus sp. 17376]|uniref:Uncharacterized protein n=1 Tax=Mesobacillus boroniphilus JCM 21738 TaxID=1294265 RepID=W4RTC7_9BACI|nr:hypothetical protein [Mesobacillus boroniphilus]ESU32007.1 hypothetical protein G3A_13585 [Bacillus sp. 17376]GAE47118.1 hypothetical protein JCM21738_4066 [Mesobacillus boroniphilus JCM 21738]